MSGIFSSDCQIILLLSHRDCELELNISDVPKRNVNNIVPL